MPENSTREDLMQSYATMNQMRNVVYHMVKFMMEKGIKENDIIIRLKRMGKNIAATEATLFKIQKSEPDLMIKQIYSDVLDSKVTITTEQNPASNSVIYTIEDKKCALCKYRREDISVSPGELIPSMVSELLSMNGVKVLNYKVVHSRTLGDLSCVHSYEVVKEEI